MTAIAAGRLHEHGDRGAARQGLDSGRAAPRVQVEERPTADRRLEDREQRLLDPIAERPRPLARRDEADPARRAGDDPAGARARPAGAGACCHRAQAAPAGSAWATRASQPRGHLAVERLEPGSEPARLVEHRLGGLAGADGELAMVVALERGDPEARQAALDEAQHVALAAQLPVALRELEAVADLGDRLEPRLRGLVGRVGDEHAERRHLAAPDAAAELVELREPEPIRALDDHHRRLGHVDPDLDDRRADEHVQVAVAEARHLGVAVGGLQPAVHEPDPQRREQLAQAHRLGLGGRRGRVPEPAGPSRGRASSSVASSSSISGTTTNVRWPGRGLLANLLPRALELVRPADPGPDRKRGPPAASAGSETSRSAYRTWPSVRGIGVAVMSRTCGARPPPAFASSWPRCSTPNRCCSSMTDDAEPRERHPLLDQRVRPDDDRRHARGDELERVARARGRVSEPVSSSTGMRGVLEQRVSVRWCWRARRSVGARSAPCRPARAAAASA